MVQTVFQNSNGKTKKLPAVFYRNGNVPYSVRTLNTWDGSE